MSDDNRERLREFFLMTMAKAFAERDIQIRHLKDLLIQARVPFVALPDAEHQAQLEVLESTWQRELRKAEALTLPELERWWLEAMYHKSDEHKGPQ